MAVIQASSKDIELITDMLIDEYINLNDKIWTDFYKTDKDLIYNHIKSNIDNPENWFEYFLLEDKQNGIIGILNILFHKDRWEILMICLKPNFNNSENFSELLNYWINYLKSKNISIISFETHPSEEIYINELNKKGAVNISSKRILSN